MVDGTGISSDRRRRAVGPALALLALLASVATWGEGGADVLVVEIEAAGDTEELRGELVLESASGGGDAVRIALENRRRFEVATSEGSLWRIRAEVAGQWAAEEVAVAGGDGARVRLFPSGELAGTLRLPPGASPPSSLRVHFRASVAARLAAPGTRLPVGAVDCPVSDLRWACILPGGLHDLRLHARSFASALVWDVALPAGGSRTLVPVTLVSGAAVLGRVELQGGDASESPASVEVDLRPAGAGWRDRHGPERLEDLFRSTAVDARGFFQFEDVTPGVYRIEARANGRVPAVLPSVEVVAGREADLGPPLVLTIPSALTIFVDPPTPPAGRSWLVQLVPVGGSEIGPTARTDWSGAAVLSSVQPGEYTLAAESRWHQRTVEVLAHPISLEIRLPQVAVRGIVRRGGEPVRARIDFGGAPPRSEEISLYADFEGRFSGHLPDEGEWPVGVVLERGGAEQRLEPVTVERRPGDDAAVVELDLADTRIDGTVVDADGAPVEHVLVMGHRGGSRAGASSRTQSDDRGHFRFVGLTPGSWILTAFRSASAGGKVEIELVAGEPAEVRLRLGGTRTIRGRVTSAAGPVAGATIMSFCDFASPRQQALAPVRTAPDGSFQDEIPGDAVGVHLAVMPPGFAARLLHVPLPPAAEETPPVEVFVDDMGGILVLDLGEDRGLSLVHGAARVPPGIFHAWQRFHRSLGADHQRQTLPWMEVGRYELCGLDRCESGALAPGDTLLLSLADAENAEAPSPAGE
jgi:hypothetical protein